MAGNLNTYGDHRIPTDGNFGVDIAKQRADDLDNMALGRLCALEAPSRALDVASAAGGQALRMARAGAHVTALDIGDYSDAFLSAARAVALDDKCAFERQDITKFDVATNLGSYDVIVCQRMIHYVPHSTAISIILNLKNALANNGRLYISASGLHSELGNDYAAAFAPIEGRYEPLADPMAEKHAIKGPVCLYSVAEFATVLETAGLRVERVFASSFGNVKAVAKL
ncbi:class I SAM-dependent methyltransferase [Trinickia mobilis]|uniref:class I SAM-dependent methyltransferase n=1 Tax=Trinickia mobilis TaxID=2816356 RepID=UPI001A8F5B1C|nr:methyltransferase domain-containing protein [Trinickia mobilis]